MVAATLFPLLAPTAPAVAHDQPPTARAMQPLGGDIHHHLHGAVNTNTIITWAIMDGLCLDEATWTARNRVDDQCPGATRPITGQDRPNLLRQWSMRDFQFPPDGDPNPGHDHFFGTFGRYDAAIAGRDQDILAEVARTAAIEHVSYIETLLGAQSSQLRRFVANTPLPDPNPDNLGEFYDQLTQADGFTGIVDAAAAEYQSKYVGYRSPNHLNCNEANPTPACRVVIRFDFQARRTDTPKLVFAQLILGVLLASDASTKVVGVNLVQPEDDPTALRDYRLHMAMVGFLTNKLLNAKFSLHAGELVYRLNQVQRYMRQDPPPEDPLSFHVRAAVEAGVKRIGHGVDFFSEADPEGLAATMRERHILVEVPLSSNDGILRVTGRDHPLQRWLNDMADRVPVTLSSDDPGITNSTLASEYQFAIATQSLTNEQLVTLSRASLDHAFVEGENLWIVPDNYQQNNVIDICRAIPLGTTWDQLDPACRDRLHASTKATLQWQYEIDRKAAPHATLSHDDRTLAPAR